MRMYILGSSYLCFLLSCSLTAGILLNSTEVTSIESDFNDGDPPDVLCADEELEKYCSLLSAMDLANCANLSLSCDCESLVVLNASEFEYLDENTVSFNHLNLEVQLNTSQGLPVVCANFSQNGTLPHECSLELPPGYTVLLYLGFALSILGISLVFVTFCLFEELHTFSAKIIVTITIALLGTKLLSFLPHIEAIRYSGLCDVFAISLHFFILAQFSWMTIMCFEVCHSFYHASHLIPVQMERKRYKLLVYQIVGWTIPSIIVVATVIVNYSTSGLVQYGLNPDWNRACWIRHSMSELVAFVIPCALFIVLQCILFALGGYFLVTSSKNRNPDSSKKNTPYVRVVVAMFFSSNLLWVLGLITVKVNTFWVWYPFFFLLVIQSFVIFLGFYGTKRVLKLYVAMFSKICVVTSSYSSS